MREWVSELKVGDEVAVPLGISGRNYAIGMVERISATQLRVSSSQYRRSDGRLIGGGKWHSHYLQQMTPEIRAAVHRRELRHRVTDIKWDEVSTEVLEQVLALVQSAEKRSA